MLDLLDDADRQGHLACYSDELFNIPVYKDKCFYDLYDPEAPFQISRDVQERIAVIFSRLPKWQDYPDIWPTSFAVQVDDGPNEEAPSIAWAHAQALQNVPEHIGCLAFPTIRKSASLDVVVNEQKVSLYFVGCNHSYCDFFRWLIVEITTNPAEMAKLSPSAFPALVFVDNVFNGIKDMSKPYRELVPKIVHHLGVISDHGKRIFQGAWDKAPAELGALGVNASDENGNTKGNSTAYKQRIAIFQGVETVFWWHSKLQKDRDRIHFNPDQVHKGGKIIVGIFCRHLT